MLIANREIPKFRKDSIRIQMGHEIKDISKDFNIKRLQMIEKESPLSTHATHSSLHNFRTAGSAA